MQVSLHLRCLGCGYNRDVQVSLHLNVALFCAEETAA